MMCCLLIRIEGMSEAELSLFSPACTAHGQENIVDRGNI